jgi:predicted dehydrogenase
MIAAAEASGAATQVAFNRRFVPLVQELKRQLERDFAPPDIQHISYDFTRIGRTDADFSATAIHGIDTVRFLAGGDYAHIRFQYKEFPQLGPTAANILMVCTLASGATAHLNFCPVAGVVVERATVHLYDHTFYLHIPMWGGLDTPGRLQHLERGEVKAAVGGAGDADPMLEFELMGFYGENAAFFDALRSGRRPRGDLKDARQSVEVAQCMRERKSEYVAQAPAARSLL